MVTIAIFALDVISLQLIIAVLTYGIAKRSANSQSATEESLGQMKEVLVKVHEEVQTSERIPDAMHENLQLMEMVQKQLGEYWRIRQTAF